MTSASATCQTELTALVYEHWRVPLKLRRRLLRALLNAPTPQAQTLRFHVAQVRAHDPDHAVLRVLTPQGTLALVEDFHTRGLFSRKEASQIEEAILHGVNRQGQWKSLRSSHMATHPLHPSSTVLTDLQALAQTQTGERQAATLRIVAKLEAAQGQRFQDEAHAALACWRCWKLPCTCGTPNPPSFNDILTVQQRRREG